jgi:hypothetical protein
VEAVIRQPAKRSPKLLDLRTPPPEGDDPVPVTINVDQVVLVEPDPDDAGRCRVTMPGDRVLTVLDPYAAISDIIAKRRAA